LSRLLLYTALSLTIASAACVTVPADEILHPDSIWASSTLYDGIGDYSAWNTQDNDLNTAWVEGAAGNGIGEYLAFGIPSGTTVTGIFLSPGYLKSEDLFYKNAAPTRLLVYSGGQSVTVDCSGMASKYVAYSDANWGTWDFNVPIVSDGTVYVEISAARDGTYYSDTCINEVQLIGKGTAGSSFSGNGYPGSSSSNSSSNGTSGLNYDWYKSGKLYYGAGVLVSIEYWNDGTFRITRNDGEYVNTYDFSRDGYSRIENGAIVYAIPEQKVLFEYYTNGDYLHFHTRYEDEYYY